VHVVHGAGAAYDAIDFFDFIVSGGIDIEFDEDEFVATGATATITGRVVSEAHDLAIANNLEMLLNHSGNGITTPLTYASTWFAVDGQEVSVNADGTFSFTVPAPTATGTATLIAIVEEADGITMVQAAGNPVLLNAANRADVPFNVVTQEFMDLIQELLDAIADAEAESIDVDGVTDRSIARLLSAIEAARAAQNSPARNMASIRAAMEALQVAIDTLVEIDEMGDLNAAIARAQSFASMQASFTRMSWSSMQTALSAAISVRDNANSTEAQIANAASRLWGAINGLIIIGVDWTTLDAIMAQAGLVDEASIPQNEWVMLQDAITNAQAVKADAAATQQMADAAISQLRNVLDNLTFVAPEAVEPEVTEPEAPETLPETDEEVEPEAEITEPEAEHVVQPEAPEVAPELEETLPEITLPEMEEVEDEMEEVLPEVEETLPEMEENEPVAEEEVQPEAEEVIAPSVDFSALDAAIAQALAVENIGFARTFWSAFQQSITSAQAVRADVDATQDAVDNAVDMLISAINNML
jgi:hypothetical protein